MLPYLATFINTNGLAFPDTLTVNASGPSATDGTEVNKNMVDDLWGSRYALMDKAGIAPNSIAEAPGASQMLEATEKAFGLGAGIEKFWGLELDPAVTGHRMLLLSKQGVLRTSYPDLDTAIYVGDGLNPTAPYKYHADDAAGTIRNIAGIYLILPPGKQLYERQYLGDGTDLTVASVGCSIGRAVFRPYRTSDGTWFIRGNIEANTFTAATGTITIPGVTSVAFSQDAGGQQSSFSNTLQGIFGVSSGAITWFAPAIPSAGGVFFLDIELASEPTWTDGFNYPLAISY